MLSNDKTIDNIRKTIKGFGLTRYKPGFGLAFRTKKDTATPALAKRMNVFLRDTLLENNVFVYFEKTYKTVNFVIK